MTTRHLTADHPRLAFPLSRTLHWVLRLFALNSRHAGRHLLLGFTLGGLGVGLNVGIYGLAGWYHVHSVHLDARPLIVSGLLGYLVLTAIPEEIAFRGVLFRVLERGFGTIAALVVSSLAFGLVHLANPGATVIGALGTAVAAGVMLSAAYLLTRNLWLAIGIHWAADFWQGAVFGLHPTGTTFNDPLLHASLNGPTLWTGDQYGGGLVGLTIGCSAGAVLIYYAARRHHLHPWHLPLAQGVATGDLVRRPFNDKSGRMG